MILTWITSTGIRLTLGIRYAIRTNNERQQVAFAFALFTKNLLKVLEVQVTIYLYVSRRYWRYLSPARALDVKSASVALLGVQFTCAIWLALAGLALSPDVF